MTKTQLKTLATQIHGLAVKSANGKKTAQNKALEKIATLLNQTIEAEIKQAYAGIASQVRGWVLSFLYPSLQQGKFQRLNRRHRATCQSLQVSTHTAGIGNNLLNLFFALRPHSSYSILFLV
jgi:hypothetical protein